MDLDPAHLLTSTDALKRLYGSPFECAPVRWEERVLPEKRRTKLGRRSTVVSREFNGATADCWFVGLALSKLGEARG